MMREHTDSSYCSQQQEIIENSGKWPSYSVELCNSLETDPLEDEEIKSLLKEGITPSSLLEAAHMIQKKEKSSLLKLNLDLECEEEVDCIENLQEVLDIACSFGTMQVTLDCIESDRTKSIMLKIQAPFSALMMLIGSSRIFKWICVYPLEMHRALRVLTEKTADFCIKAISRGTPILSLADPSGMLELLGKKRYEEFCGFYVLLLLRRLQPYLDKTVVHICPRTSLILEKLGLLQGEMSCFQEKNYADAVLRCAGQSDIRILGHRCINLGHSADRRIYVLNLKSPMVHIRRLEEKDWLWVSEIYDEGIRSKKATVVKTLPAKDVWIAAHGKCLVAEYLGSVIGFIALNKETIPEVSVYIEKGFQNQRVGTTLLLELQRQTEGKLRSLIFQNNTASICLHESCGFRRMGEFTFAGDPRQVLIYEWEV